MCKRTTLKQVVVYQYTCEHCGKTIATLHKPRKPYCRACAITRSHSYQQRYTLAREHWAERRLS